MAIAAPEDGRTPPRASRLHWVITKTL